MLIKTVMSRAIEDFLNTDRLINLNILGAIENLPEAEIFVDDIAQPKGVFVRKGYFHYLYSKEDAFIDEVAEIMLTEGFYGFTGVEDSIAKKIQKKFQVTWEVPNTLYYLPKDRQITEPIMHPVQPVDIKDAEIIDAFYTYRNDHSLAAIKRDILERPSSAVYIDGEPVCWVLLHDDNAMGYMFTREEHRYKGYAADVSIDLIAKIRAMGKTPFLQIVKGNSMSPGLAAKCGFEACGHVTWFGIVSGTPKELLEASRKSKKQLSDSLKEVIKGCMDARFDTHKDMYLFLHNLTKENNGMPEFYVEEIEVLPENTEKDQYRINVWCDTMCRGCEIPEDKGPGFKQALLQSVTGMKGYHLYTGYLNGNPVASTALLALDKETSGGYFWAVLPEARNRGVGADMTVETLKKAQLRGVELVFLLTPDVHIPLFERLGFHTFDGK